jgi:hypothetical protein
MPSIQRYLDDGTLDLRRAFERSPDIQRLMAGGQSVADYCRLLERLRRGFAAVELQAFEEVPETARPLLGAHRSTWRISHDIGILGGKVMLPIRPEDLANIGALPSWSARLGAHWALARIVGIMHRAHARLESGFGRPLLGCLLFAMRRDPKARRFTAAVDQLIEQAGPALDWSEALAGARRTLRAIRHGLGEGMAREQGGAA